MNFLQLTVSVFEVVCQMAALRVKLVKPWPCDVELRLKCRLCTFQFPVINFISAAVKDMELCECLRFTAHFRYRYFQCFFHAEALECCSEIKSVGLDLAELWWQKFDLDDICLSLRCRNLVIFLQMSERALEVQGGPLGEQILMVVMWMLWGRELVWTVSSLSLISGAAGVDWCWR